MFELNGDFWKKLVDVLEIENIEKEKGYYFKFCVVPILKKIILHVKFYQKIRT